MSGRSQGARGVHITRLATPVKIFFVISLLYLDRSNWKRPPEEDGGCGPTKRVRSSNAKWNAGVWIAQIPAAATSDRDEVSMMRLRERKKERET